MEGKEAPCAFDAVPDWIPTKSPTSAADEWAPGAWRWAAAGSAAPR